MSLCTGGLFEECQSEDVVECVPSFEFPDETETSSIQVSDPLPRSELSSAMESAFQLLNPPPPPPPPKLDAPVKKKTAISKRRKKSTVPLKSNEINASKLSKSLCRLKFRLRPLSEWKTEAIFDDLHAVGVYFEMLSSPELPDLYEKTGTMVTGDEDDCVSDFVDLEPVKNEDEQTAETCANFLLACHDALVCEDGTDGFVVHPRTVRRRLAKTVSTGPFLCAFCAQSIATAPALEVHVAAIHGVRKKFACLRCNFRSNSRCMLIDHVRWSREGKLVKCRQVNWSFYSKIVPLGPIGWPQFPR